LHFPGLVRYLPWSYYALFLSRGEKMKLKKEKQLQIINHGEADFFQLTRCEQNLLFDTLLTNLLEILNAKNKGDNT